MHRRSKRYSTHINIVNTSGVHVETVGDPTDFKDDVTGDRIPPEFAAYQDGLLKDRRVSRGSWNTVPIELAYTVHIGYDPELGYPTKPAGSF